jgi:hypothetical protein
MYKSKKISLHTGIIAMNFNYIKKSVFTLGFLLGIWLLLPPASASAASRTLIILPFINDGARSHTWVASGISDYLERAIRSNSS